MSGKVIVIEGLDGSGKATQAKKLYDSIKEMGKKVISFSFPNYDDDSSALVRMYLNGEMADNAEDVNCYAASSFYSVDRYASYMKYLKKDYEDGAVIVLDRYTTSNAVHQASKLPREDWDSFLEWLEDFEYVKLGLPKPDAVIYLDMSPETSQKLLSSRYHGDETKKDIHEKNVDYMNSCRVAALYVADKLGWSIVKCDRNGEPLSIDEIAQQVKALAFECIK